MRTSKMRREIELKKGWGVRQGVTEKTVKVGFTAYLECSGRTGWRK